MAEFTLISIPTISYAHWLYKRTIEKSLAMKRREDRKDCYRGNSIMRKKLRQKPPLNSEVLMKESAI